MPGPRPKPPGLRSRKNKASTRAKLGAGGGPTGARVPALPMRGCPCGGPPPQPKRKKGQRGRPRLKRPPCTVCADTAIVPWNRLVLAWWARLWGSPMAGEFIESDLDALFTLAALKDEFWTRAPGDSKLAAEIRQQEARFGLTPLDRRRLEWELERPEQPEQEAPTPTDPPKPVVDPRKTMRLVG